MNTKYAYKIHGSLNLDFSQSEMGDIGRLWRNNKFKHGFNGKAITETTIQKMQGQYENMSIISYRTRLLRFKLESDRNPTEIVSEHGNKSLEPITT